MRPPAAEDARVAELFKGIEDMRERQVRSEFRSDLDVGALALVFFAASISPVALPWLPREPPNRTTPHRSSSTTTRSR
ncbi:hypothetical protein [Streptomyces sp. LUP47B]|uniref:hypothetical protein n=1 Tax=Streptomyces sp. LUP47B TaxID=1890286 RepID=UPI00114CD1AD|nr:hypothetical protein [Streptomyces sp. LUP47B]